VKKSSKITESTSKLFGLLEWELINQLNNLPENLILISHFATHENIVFKKCKNIGTKALLKFL